MNGKLALFAAFLTTIANLRAEDPFATLVRPTEALSAEEELTKLRVPDGFTIQLFASEPLINKPINLGFDKRGRLWVSSTVEYPFPAPKSRWADAEGSRVRDSRDAIKILEDTNGDGKADKAHDFANGLNVPIGVLPYGNGCIAWSIPNIWYFEDTDGDDVCDRRSILFGPLGYEKDTHGNIASLRMGADGWVYATHGFNNTSKFEVRPEKLAGRKLGDAGTTLELNSGNVFRFKPDGSSVEIWSHGQVNPFGMCQDSWGNIYTADCHSNPITQLIYGAHYPSFGKPHGGLGFAPVLCEHSHGSTGLCGVAYFDGGLWGAEWQDHMLVGNCVTSRINRDLVTYKGATPRANEQPDFLVSEDPWFRPVDLQIGPDGALYVADFYNKIIGHYEVDLKHPGRDRERGRIWRIAKAGVSSSQREGGPQQLTAQQWRAAGAAGDLPDQADARLKRVWAELAALTPRREHVEKLLGLLASCPAEDASLHMTLRIALRETLQRAGGFALLPKILPEGQRSEILEIARSADSAEAGRWLLAWLQEHPRENEQLAPSIAMIARHLPSEVEGTLAAMAQERLADDWASQLGLLLAMRDGLAQHGTEPGNELKDWAGKVAAAFSDGSAGVGAWSPLARVGEEQTWKVETREKEGGGAIPVLTSLPAPQGGEVERRTGTLVSKPFPCPPQLVFWLCGHRGFPDQPAHEKNFARLVDAATGAELQRAYPPRQDAARRVVWDVSAHAKKLVRMELADGDAADAYAWLAAGGFEPALDLRLEENNWEALASLAATFKLQVLALPLSEAFKREGLPVVACAAIARALTELGGQESLLSALCATSPLRKQAILAEAMASRAETASLLCTAVPARLLLAPNIRQKINALGDAALLERVKVLTENLPPSLPNADALIAARLKGFSASLQDATGGEEIFTANCAVCHRIGGKGGVVGPQLDGAGNRGVERLCEDILDPNRALDPAFHARMIKRKDGSLTSGLLRSEEGGVMVVLDVLGQETRISKADVASAEDLRTSLMPAAFGESIAEADFYKLLAWLAAQRK